MKNPVLKICDIISAALAALTDRTHHQPVNYANIKALLLYLCDFDEDKCLWVMRWLAYPLRNPGAKMSRALVVAGPEGAGKRLFFERIVMELYEDGGARTYLRPLDTIASWPVGTRLMIIDGDLSPGYLDRLRGLVTARDMMQSTAGRAAVRRPNRTNFILLADSPRGLLAANSGQRRLYVVDTPGPISTAFRRSVEYEIESDGVDAFRDFLMRDLDMGDFDELTPPPVSFVAHAPLVA
jgi:putative DNA primase/helicase